MPNPAARIRRILHLLERLQSGRVHNAQELAEFCGVSRRTLFRDLKILQQSGVNVLYDSQKLGYWLAQGVLLPPTELSLAETLSLIMVSQEIGSNKHGVPFLEPASQAGMKLLSNLPNHLRTHVGELIGKVELRVGPFVEQRGSQKFYHLLMQAIAERKRVRLTYDSLHERETISTLVSPYRLSFIHRSWYVIGRSSLHRAVRTFHLGRIQEAELTADDYEIPPRFTLQRFFGNAWRMIRKPGQRTNVIIRFAPLVARNVAEVTWHKTQKVIWNEDGSIDFQVVVDGIDEISWWILGYGDKARVLEPEALKDLICRHISSMAAQYGLTVNGTETAMSESGRSVRKRGRKK